MMRFLTTYASDLSNSRQVDTLTTSLVDLIAFCLSAGDTFLPDPASYDDLFYKLVETGPILSRFRDAYKPTLSHPFKPPATDGGAAKTGASIDTLISVSTHFHALLFQPEKATAEGEADAAATLPPIKKKNLSPREVHDIIKQGYDTLSIQTHEGLTAWEKWREADWKSELKRIARCTVEDARKVVS